MMEETDDNPEDVIMDRRRIAMDPRGDLVLVLEGVDLRVNSKALSLASKVFRKLFKKGFKEGNAIQSGSKDVVSIELPEDDDDTITTICWVFHHSYDQISGISIEDMANIALTADKYDCVHAISPWFAMYARNFQHLSTEVLAKELLFPAFALNECFAFQDVTRQMFYSLEGFEKPTSIFSRTVTYGIDHKTRDFLPSYLLKTIVSWEWEIKNLVLIKLQELIFPLLDQDYNDFPPMRGDIVGGTHGSFDDERFSECDARHTGLYIQALRARGLWPLSAVLEDWTINGFLFQIKSIYVKFSPTAPAERECRSCFLRPEKLLKQLTEWALSYFPGLCLDCVKGGPEHWKKKGRKCRIDHKIDLGITNESYVGGVRRGPEPPWNFALEKHSYDEDTEDGEYGN